MFLINNIYTRVHDENKRQIAFLKEFGCDEKLLDEIVKDENDRIAGRHPTPRHKKPGPKKKKKNKKSSGGKSGPAKGTKRSAMNKDGSYMQKTRS